MEKIKDVNKLQKSFIKAARESNLFSLQDYLNHALIKDKDIESRKHLLNIQDKRKKYHKNTALHYAVLNDNILAIKFLVDNGAYLDITNSHGFTPLMLAAFENKLNVLKMLLEKNADIDYSTSDNRTALDIAKSDEAKQIIKDARKRRATVNQAPVPTIQHPTELGKSSVLAQNTGQPVDNKSLLKAARKGDLPEVKRCLGTFGININIKEDDEKNCYRYIGFTPLHYAADNGHYEVVSYLIEKGANINAKDAEDWTPLHCAADENIGEIVKLLLEKGADIQAQNEEGFTPLHTAANEGHVDIAEILLDKGAEIEAKDKEGSTPLHCAVGENQEKMVECLLKRGANKEAQENDGTRPLHVAAEEGYLEIVKVLLREGADKEAKDKEGSTPLHVAAEEGYLEIVKVLLKKGADKNAKDKEGSTPLHYAIYEDKEEVVEYLLEKGANKEAQENDGARPLHVAAEEGYLNIVKLLLQHGANIEAKDAQGWTPLHYAADKNREYVVGYLLEKNASVNAQINQSQTCFDITKAKKHNTIVKLLQDKLEANPSAQSLVVFIYMLLEQYGNDLKALFQVLSQKGITWSKIKQELLFKQGLTNDDRREGKNLVRQLIDKRTLLDQTLYKEVVDALFPQTRGYAVYTAPDGVVEKDLNGFKVKFYNFLVFDKIVPFTEHNPTARPHLVVEIKAPGSQELTSDIDTTLSVKHSEKINLAHVKWPDAWRLKGYFKYDNNILLQAALISYYNQLNQTYFKMTSGESRDANVYADGFLNEQGYPKPKASLVGFEAAELAKLDISAYQYDKHQLELAASLVSLYEYFKLTNKSDDWDSFVIDLQQLWADQTSVDVQKTQEFNTRINKAFAKAKELAIYKKEKLEAYIKDNLKGYVSSLQGEALVKDKEIEAMNKLYEQHLIDLSLKFAQVKAHKDNLNAKKIQLTKLKPKISSHIQALNLFKDDLKEAPDNEVIKDIISQNEIALANLKEQKNKLGFEIKQAFNEYTKLIIEQFERQVKTNLFANEAYVNQSAPYHVVLGLQSKNTELPLDKKRIVMGSILQEIGFRLLHAEQLRKAHQAEGLILYQMSKYGNRVAEMLFGQLEGFYDNKIFTEEEIRTIKDTGSIKVLARLKNDKKTYHQHFTLAEYKTVNADTDFVVNVKRDANIDLDRKAGKAEYLFKYSLFKHLHPNQPSISDNDVNAVDLKQFRAKINADVNNWLSIFKKIIVYTFESKIDKKDTLWGGVKQNNKS